MRTLVAVDWFQIGVISLRIDKPVFHSNYEVKNSELRSKHFSVIEYIFEKKRLIATVTREPHSRMIPKETILIKFENDYLYQKNFPDLVKQFLHNNQMELKNFSRLDFCIDFNFFAKKLNPEFLIRRFLNLKYLRMGKGKFSVHGESNYTNTYQYLRFGRNASDISVYLYNKTREMEQIKNKPWIYDNWIESGLNVNIDVWRLEFSIKNSCKYLFDTVTDTLIDFKSLSILTEQNKEIIFQVLTRKYFTFLVNDGCMNKSRMNKIKLFKDFENTFQITDLTEKKDSTRKDKIFIKALNELQNELAGTADDLCESGIDLKTYFIGSRGLEEWAKRKEFA